MMVQVETTTLVLQDLAFGSFKLKNDIDNDVGHFYPSEFTKDPPASVKNGSQTIKEYAESKGINTQV